MAASGVIPRPEERPPIQPIGHLFDVNGTGVEFWVSPGGLVYFTIATGVNAVYLDKQGREEFSRLYFEAERQAKATMPP